MLEYLAPWQSFRFQRRRVTGLIHARMTLQRTVWASGSVGRAEINANNNV